MNIILAITGSISAYKSYDIARGLINAGHTVRVIFSQGAMKFIRHETFHYLGVEKTYLPQDDFNIEQKTKNVLHMELVDWMDLFIVAPLSANTLANFAHGKAQDLISSIFLAMADKACVLFPAMNTRMLGSPATQRNLEFIRSYKNVWIHSSGKGELACGDIGEGKLPPVDQIVEIAPTWNPNLKNKKILITTGATLARLDPVRYLTNPASGLTGYLLAKQFLAQGFFVDLIYGLGNTPQIQYLNEHPNCQVFNIETTSEMERKVFELIESADTYISAAAIGDIEFVISDKKIKKNTFGDSLPIKKSTDILAKVLDSKRDNKRIIGFAAETGNDPAIFLEKWNRKPVDLLVGNFVDAKLKKGFGATQNTYYFIANGKLSEAQELTKTELCQKLVEFNL